MNKVARALVALAGSGALLTAAASPISITEYRVQTAAEYTFSETSFTNAINSDALVQAATIDGHSFSAARNSSTASATLATLTGSFSSERFTGPYRSTGRAVGWFQFDALVDATFDMTGGYTAQDATLEASSLSLTVELFDTTTNDLLTYLVQRSQSTVDESFSLGDGTGDAVNALEGSLTGQLVAGHSYFFRYEAVTYGNNSATAGGHVELAIQEGFATATAVPEPNALALVGIALCGAAASARRRPTA